MGLIVGLTGDVADHDVRHFKWHGADDVLPKPFKIEDFNDIVAAYFRMKAVMRSTDVTEEYTEAEADADEDFDGFVDVRAALEALGPIASSRVSASGASASRAEPDKTALTILMIDDSASTRYVMLAGITIHCTAALYDLINTASLLVAIKHVDLSFVCLFVCVF